jgi:hypothetical protein
MKTFDCHFLLKTDDELNFIEFLLVVKLHKITVGRQLDMSDLKSQPQSQALSFTHVDVVFVKAKGKSSKSFKVKCEIKCKNAKIKVNLTMTVSNVRRSNQ